MSRSNFFFLFFFFFFSPTKIYISSTRVFLRSKKYTTNTNVIELGRREREREKLNGVRYQLYFSTNLFWTVLGRSRAPRWRSLELNSHHGEHSLRAGQNAAKRAKFFLPFLSFFFISRGFFAFRLVSPRAAMAVHRRCSRVYSSVARTFYRFYPRPMSDFDGKSIFRDENHPATQLRHSDWNPFAFPWTNDEPSNVGEKKGGNELELVVYRFPGKCDRLSANLATFPARTNVSWSLEIPILLYEFDIFSLPLFSYSN